LTDIDERITRQIAGKISKTPPIAIITDISVLSLPAGVDGMAGLSFLRQFARWGAERAAPGWQFFLSNSND
jgi:hypothetical protein